MRRLGILAVTLVLVGLVWVTTTVVRPPPTEDGAEVRTDGSGPARATGDQDSLAPTGARGSCWLSGRVEREGRPLAARVEIYIEPPRGDRPCDRLVSPDPTGRPACVLDATADGRFLARDLPPGEALIGARTVAGERGRARTTLFENRPSDPVIIAVTGGGESLSGTVVHTDGRAFRGLVWAVPGQHVFVSSGEPASPVRPDLEGRFRLEGLVPGPHVLILLEPGRLRIAIAGFDVPVGDDVRVIVEDGLRPVRGRVVAEDGGAPIAAARVEYASDGGHRRTDGLVETTEEGRFRALLVDGRGGATVRAPGYAPAQVSLPAGEDEIEIRLRRRGVVTGRVLSGIDGATLAGVTVRGLSLDRGVRRLEHRASQATTDARGRFRLEDAGPGPVALRVIDGGWISETVLGLVAGEVEERSLHVEPGTTEWIDLVVVPAARVEGRVVDADRRPVVGVVVIAETPGAWSGLRHRGTARTAEDGAFAIGDLVPGFRYAIAAHPVEGVPGRAGPFTAMAGETPGLEIVLPRPRWIEVRVLDSETRQPIADADVNARGRAPNPWRTEGRTAEGGVIRLGPVPPGPFWIRVHHEGHVSTSPFADAWPADARELVVHLRSALTIEGRVVGAGEDADRLQVIATPVETADSRAPPVSARADLGDDGSFRLDGLLPGTHTVRVWGNSGSLGEWTFEAGERNAVLTIDRTSAAPPPAPRHMTVRVLDPDGEPVSWMNAAVYQHDLRHRTQWGGFEGRFVAGPGVSRVWFEIYGAKNAARELLGAGRFGPFDPAADGVEIRLPPPAVIEGRILDPEGAPVAGALVRVAPIREGSFPREDHAPYHAAGRSAEDGRFRLTGLGEGRHWLRVEPPPGYLAEPATEVVAGDPAVTVTLARASAVTLRILDRQEKPVSGAEVIVSRETSRSTVRARSDGQGRARVEGLAPREPHQLFVRPPPGREDVGPFRDRAWIPVEGDVRLPPTVRGFVRDSAGKPVAGALVWSRTDGMWVVRTVRADNGAFVIDTVTGPTVTLRATMRGARPEEPGVVETTVEAGAEGVILRVDPGLRLVVEVVPAMSGTRAVLRLEGVEAIERAGESRTWGVFVFRGLRPGATYTLHVVAAEAGGALVMKGVRADAGRLVVTPAPGRSILGRVDLPVVMDRVIVRARQGALTVEGEVTLEGTFVVKGLTEGVWSLTAYARRGENSWIGTAEVEGGTETVIELTPRER